MDSRYAQTVERAIELLQEHAGMVWDSEVNWSGPLKGEIDDPDAQEEYDELLRIAAELEALRVSPAVGVIVPADLWDEIGDFIDDHVDVRDGSDGPVPNTAMHLAERIKHEVAKPKAKLTGDIVTDVIGILEAPRPAEAQKSKLDPTSSWPFPTGVRP